MNELLQKLKEEIAFEKENNPEHLDETSWGSQRGIIITVNEAEMLVNALTPPPKMTLEDMLLKVQLEFSGLGVYLENGLIVVEEYFNAIGDEKNDDDCADLAQENGEEIVEKFPELEVVNYFCHRHKYSIVELKMKEQ